MSGLFDDFANSEDREEPDWATDETESTEKIIEASDSGNDESTEDTDDESVDEEAIEDTGDETVDDESTEDGSAEDKEEPTIKSSLSDDDEDDFDFGSISLSRNTEVGVSDSEDEKSETGAHGGSGLAPVSIPGSGGGDGSSVPDGVPTVSFEERARQHADSLISTILAGGGEEYDNDRRWFYSNATPELFTEENYLIYSVIHKFRGEGFNIDREFLEVYLGRNLGQIDAKTGLLDVNKYGEIDGSYERGYLAGTVKHFDDIASREPIPHEDFRLTFEKYIQYFKHVRGLRVYNDAVTILEDGLKTKKTKGLKAGFEDAANFTRRGIADIEGQIDRNEGTGFRSMTDIIMNKDDSRDQIVKVGDYGRIDELNNHFGGIYTGELITVVGPPKAGKTKFCTRLLYDMVRAGKNVTIWPSEGGPRMLEAQLRAIHFHETYNGPIFNGEKDASELITGLSQKTIIQDSYEEVSTKIDVRRLEENSAIDLATNPAYGNIDVIDRPLTVETFIEEIDLSVSSNDSDAILVDYLQLMQSNRNMKKPEILSEAYPMALDYCKKNGKTMISPAQYSQDAVRELSKNGAEKMDVRTAIGESSAIMRSSDLVIAMYASADDIRNQMVSFFSIPARLSEPFETFTAYAELGSCTFMTDKSNEDD